MSIVEVVRKEFPSYEVVNASDQNAGRLIFLIEECKIKPKRILYIERNEKTESFFQLFEVSKLMEGVVAEGTKFIFYNRDNYINFRKGCTEKKMIRMIRKALLEKETCVICLHREPQIVCGGCSETMCASCIHEMDGLSCPVCRQSLDCRKPLF